MRDKVLIFVLLVLAVILRAPFMSRGLFYDELYVVTHYMQANQLFPPGYFQNYWTSNHLGYTVIGYFLTHLFGASEWVVRFPALIFGLASIILFWFWARNYFGWITAFIGASLLVFSPASIIWSTSARGYSALIFFVLLSSCLYFSLIEKPSVKSIVLLVLTNTIGLSFHAFFGAIILIQIFHLLIMAVTKVLNRQTVVPMAAALGLSILCPVLLYLPLLSQCLGHQVSTHGPLLPYFPVTMLGELLSLPWFPLGLICVILMVIGLSLPQPRLKGWRIYIALVFLIVIPVWLHKPEFLYSRFFAFLLVFIALGIALAIDWLLKIFPKAYGAIVAASILLFGLMVWSWCKNPSSVVEEFKNTFKEAVAFAEGASSDTTPLCAFGPEDAFYQYYAHRPVVRFNSFGEFLSFYSQGKEALCFCLMGPPMNIEHQKILMFMLSNAQYKAFDKVDVFYLKPRS